MQRAFISSLLELAEKNKDIVYILADSGTNFDMHFERSFPDRIFNFGIAEQNAIGVSAGMALAGKKPYVFLQGSFIVYRAMEFVRDDICFQNIDVKLIGQGSGLSLSGLGPSHHTTEDIAVLRALPGMTIFSPASPNQAAACMRNMEKVSGPCYLRMGMSDEKELFDDGYVLPESGQDILFSGGDDVVIFTTGSIASEALEAVKFLASKEPSAGKTSAADRITLINVVRLKPFDETLLIKYAAKARRIITIEEHQIAGGLGSIVSEALTSAAAKNHGPDDSDTAFSAAAPTPPVTRIGLEDTFAAGYGPNEGQVRRENRLDAGSLAERIYHEIMQ